jgi:hypothetical protein
MEPQNKDTEMPRICEFLSQLDARGILTPKQLAFAIGKSYDAGRAKFINSDLTFDQLHLLFHADIPGANRTGIQSLLLGFLLEGTPWVPMIPEPDPVAEGECDTRVIFDEAQRSCAHCADAFSMMQVGEKSGIKLDQDDLRVLAAEICHASKKLRAASSAISLLAKVLNAPKPQTSTA